MGANGGKLTATCPECNCKEAIWHNTKNLEVECKECGNIYSMGDINEAYVGDK